MLRISIPKIPLVIGNSVPIQEFNKLLLKSALVMVSCLPRQVSLYLVQVGITHVERTIAGLPTEARLTRKCFMCPFRGVRFDESNHFGDCNFPTQRNKQMHMIWHTARGDKTTPMISTDAAGVFEETRLQVRRDERGALFGAEDDVAVQRRERLRHSISFRPFGALDCCHPHQGLTPLAINERPSGASVSRNRLEKETSSPDTRANSPAVSSTPAAWH